MRTRDREGVLLCAFRYLLLLLCLLNVSRIKLQFVVALDTIRVQYLDHTRGDKTMIKSTIESMWQYLKVLYGHYQFDGDTDGIMWSSIQYAFDVRLIYERDYHDSDNMNLEVTMYGRSFIFVQTLYEMSNVLINQWKVWSALYNFSIGYAHRVHNCLCAVIQSTNWFLIECYV